MRQDGKAYFVGEYDWTGQPQYTREPAPHPVASLAAWLDALEANDVAADLYWSLFDGAVRHDDGFTLHYPGDTPAMEVRAEQLRAHAGAVKGLAEPFRQEPQRRAQRLLPVLLLLLITAFLLVLGRNGRGHRRHDGRGRAQGQAEP